jgi:RNA polymerase sigma-70 factor (ECF subfamily)
MSNEIPVLVPDEAERAFIERLRAGDKVACAQCVADHSDGLYRMALRMMRDPQEAEDVLQETLLNAFKGIAYFDGRSSLKTWLYRIAYNTALMKLRGAKPQRVSVEDSLEAEEQGEILPEALHDWCCLPERDFETNDAREHLENAIRSLPENLRVVFVMRELEGLSTIETANALGVSEQVVKVRLHRARLALRERLSEYFGELMIQRQKELHVAN